VDSSCFGVCPLISTEQSTMAHTFAIKLYRCCKKELKTYGIFYSFQQHFFVMCTIINTIFL